MNPPESVTKIPTKIKVIAVLYILLGFTYYGIDFQYLWGPYSQDATNLSLNPNYGAFLVVVFWPLFLIYHLFNPRPYF